MNVNDKFRVIKAMKFVIYVKINLFIKVHVSTNLEGLMEHRFLFVAFVEII